MASAARDAARIIEVSVEEEMQRSYLEYAMSVIVGRALPDVRDGLKPVQRRILYAMHELGLRHDKPFKKSARIVGEVLGKYHPHGDAAVYDAMVRLAQDFTMRYTLVDGQGNFGSIDGDEPAAMRYTEARLSEVAEEMLADIDKDTVNWRLNFDSTLEEPEVLPAKFPNLLVNGSSGIAVGMATNIPPHNLSEIVDAITRVIDDPNVSIDDLMEIVKGPDFPTGGVIIGVEGIKSAYKTGRGTVRMRAKVDIERDHRGQKIIIREIPYQVNKSKLIEEIASFLKKSGTEGVAALRDESDRRGMRIIIELRSGANAEILLNRLFKHTSLETSFGIINLALINGEPRIFSLKEMIECHINHRKEVLTRKFRHELKQLEHKKHILEGILIAISHIEDVISLVKSSESAKSAVKMLKERYGLSDEQASQILEMKISRLSAIERERVERQISEISAQIKRLRALLADGILDEIKRELEYLKRKYGDARRTVIVEEEMRLSERDLVEEKQILLIFSSSGVSRIPISHFKRQSRGGKGVSLKVNDVIRVVCATTRHKIMIFTSHGRAFQVLAYEVPERGGRYAASAKLKSIHGLAGLRDDEKISAVLPIPEEIEGNIDAYSIVFVTKRGIIKRTPLSLLQSLRSSGVVAVKVAEGDALADVTLVRDGAENEWMHADHRHRIIIATRKGKLIMFPVEELREMGKYAAGVIGIRVEDDDEVVSVESASGARMSHHRNRRHETNILTITEHGYGKKTPISAYRETHRGGKGIINFRITDRTGDVVAVKAIVENDIFIATSAGMIIRIAARNIPVQGRNTRGARLMNVCDGDSVVSFDIV